MVLLVGGMIKYYFLHRASGFFELLSVVMRNVFLRYGRSCRASPSWQLNNYSIIRYIPTLLIYADLPQKPWDSLVLDPIAKQKHICRYLPTYCYFL